MTLDIQKKVNEALDSVEKQSGEMEVGKQYEEVIKLGNDVFIVETYRNEEGETFFDWHVMKLETYQEELEKERSEWTCHPVKDFKQVRKSIQAYVDLIR